jgi:uncharacterized membrane protein
MMVSVIKRHSVNVICGHLFSYWMNMSIMFEAHLIFFCVFLQSLITSYVPLGIDTLHLQEHTSGNKSNHLYGITVRVCSVFYT